MRIRPLAGLGERGFSFDLVSRRKPAHPEQTGRPAVEDEIVSDAGPGGGHAGGGQSAAGHGGGQAGGRKMPLNEQILDDPDLMVEPFETVLQQLRETAEEEEVDRVSQEMTSRILSLSDADMAEELDAEHDPAPEDEPEMVEDTPLPRMFDDEDEDEIEPEAAPAVAPRPALSAVPVREPIAEILRLLPEHAVKPEPEPADTPAPTAMPSPAPAPFVAPAAAAVGAPFTAAATPEPEAGPADAPQEAEASSTPRRGSRVKTTFIGFDRSDGRFDDVFAKEAAAKSNANRTEFPFGWVVVTKGPGRGTSIAIGPGVSQIGRGDDQAIQLDFGDTSISRNNHAAIAFDDEERKFYLGHGGKANIVRLNGKPVLSTETLSDGDLIRIGETTMAFVAFCGEDFVWERE